ADASSGSHAESGTPRSTWPASTSARTAVATIGLVIDANRHRASTPRRPPSFGPNASSRTVPRALATPRITNRTVPPATCTAPSWQARPRAAGERRPASCIATRYRQPGGGPPPSAGRLHLDAVHLVLVGVDLGVVVAAGAGDLVLDAVARVEMVRAAAAV